MKKYLYAILKNRLADLQLEKVLGPNHPRVAVNLNNLAGLYRAMKRDEEAETLEKEAARIRAIER